MSEALSPHGTVYTLYLAHQDHVKFLESYSVNFTRGVTRVLC